MSAWEPSEADVERADDVIRHGGWLVEDALIAGAGPAIAARDKRIGELKEFVADQEYTIAMLQRRVAELEGQPKRRVRHVKRGTEYNVTAAGIVQCAAPIEDMTAVLIYRADNGQHWVRPIPEFEDGRFVNVASVQEQPK